MNNKRKHLLHIGDIIIHKLYGMGIIIEINTHCNRIIVEWIEKKNIAINQTMMRGFDLKYVIDQIKKNHLYKHIPIK